MEEYIIVGKGRHAHVLTVLDTETIEELDYEANQLANEELFLLDITNTSGNV